MKHQLPNLDPKDLLPFGIEVIKGAIICGNSSTPNLLVAEFQRSEGTFGIVEVRYICLFVSLPSGLTRHTTIVAIQI